MNEPGGVKEIKQKKIVTETGNPTVTTEYAGNYIYEGNALQFFNHAEGYVEPDGSNAYNYIYQYKDHLGNIRLSYSDADGNGSINASTEIVEENNYYPFGLRHKGYNNVINGTDHKYGFAGKEEQDELGLGWIDITARNFDPAIGRWMNLDPLAEQMRRHSPYNYAFNNPIYFIDPDGMAPLGSGDPPIARDARYAALQGFQKMFQGFGRALDNAGGKIKAFFTFGDKTGGKINNTGGTIKVEKGMSVNIETTVEDFFTPNGNTNTPVSNSPVEISLEKIDRTSVSLSTKVNVEGVDVTTTLTSTQDNNTGEESNSLSVTAGKGNDGVYVKAKDDGNVTAGIKADQEIKPPLLGYFVRFGFDLSIDNEKE